jgi:hypothetical protein
LSNALLPFKTPFVAFRTVPMETHIGFPREKGGYVPRRYVIAASLNPQVQNSSTSVSDWPKV